MTLQRFIDFFSGIGGAAIIVAFVQHFLGSGGRKQSAEKELYDRLLEENKRKTGELDTANDDIAKLREIFSQLQTVHIPQTTENALMRIARGHAVKRLIRIKELIESEDWEHALEHTDSLIVELSEDIVLTHIDHGIQKA